MNVWRLRHGDGTESEPMTASEVVALLWSSSDDLPWLEGDSGHGAFAHEVPEVQALLFRDHLAAIAQAWLSRHRATPLWVSDLASDLCRDNVSVAMDLIRELVAQAKSEDELALIGAGPVEDLLSDQGPSAVGAMEAEAKINARFRCALAGA